MLRKLMLLTTGIFISSIAHGSFIADLARTCKGKDFKLVGFSNNRNHTVYLKFIETKAGQKDQNLRVIKIEPQTNMRLCTDYKMYSAYYRRPDKGGAPEIAAQQISPNKYYIFGPKGVSSSSPRRQAKIILEKIKNDYLIEKSCSSTHCKKQIRTCLGGKKLVKFVNDSQETSLWLKVYDGVLDKSMNKDRGARGNILLFPESSLVICTNYSDIKWSPNVRHGSLPSIFDAFFKAKFQGAKDAVKRYEIAQYIKLKTNVTYKINPDSSKQTVIERSVQSQRDSITDETYLLNDKSFTLIQK